MTSHRETIETTAGEVTAVLKRLGISSDERVIITLDLDQELAHRMPLNHFKLEQLRDAFCRHRGDPWTREKSLRHDNSLRVSVPMHFSRLRNPG